MVERSRRSVGATIAACRAALDEGFAVNLAGGTHHSVCVARRGLLCLQRRGRRRPGDAGRSAARRARASRCRSLIWTCIRATARHRSSAMIRACLRSRCTAIRNYPFCEGNERSRRRAARRLRRRRLCGRLVARARDDVPALRPGARSSIWRALTRMPDDRLGRLALSFDGLARRDPLVFKPWPRAIYPSQSRWPAAMAATSTTPWTSISRRSSSPHPPVPRRAARPDATGVFFKM